METIEISEAAYKKLLSRQLEGESISSVILRELDSIEEEDGWDVDKLDTHLNTVMKNSKKTCSFEEVFR